jgi:hypothetical protein
VNRWIIVVLLACGCPSTPKKPEPPMSVEGCAAACGNLSSLECKTPSGKPYIKLDGDMPCEEACGRKLLEGVELHTNCVANARNCAEVDLCAR